MRYCRFQLDGQAHYGLVEAVAGHDAIVRILLTSPQDADGDMESLRTRRIDPLPLEQAVLLAPVAPSKIVCVGRNYREHAAELGNKMPEEPLLFLKAPSAVIASGDNIELPRSSQQVEHEGELGVVIGRTAHGLADNENPLDNVFGYTCLNDVTARDLQRKDVQ